MDSLKNFGESIRDINYIFFHDQEPVHLDIHKPLFDDVIRRTRNLDTRNTVNNCAMITSEWNSEFVDQVCSQYQWSHYYYFYHGWAALDWYRGYNRTWLMPDVNSRRINKSFISPNRIVGGKRDHRVLLLYHIFKNRVKNAWISCPKICPFESLPIDQVAGKFQHLYPDICSVFQNTNLPMNFTNEIGHPMHSCWLSLFDECAETMVYLVTETVFTGRRNHLTEKIFKPICLQMPFVLVSSAGSLSYLKRYGFQTFGDIWDESYDEETNDLLRLEKIAKLVVDFDNLCKQDLQSLYDQALPVIKHNFEHFYNGGFESILWDELHGMLVKIKNDFRI